MTQEPDERAKLSTGRTVAASVTILFIAVVVSPQISGGGNLQRSLTLTTVGFAVVGCALYLWCFANTRETVQRSAETVSARQTLRMARHNPPLIVLCLATLLFLTAQFALQTVGVYYARNILGNADLYIVLTVVQTVGMLAAAAIVPAAVEAIGKKSAFMAAGLIAAAGAAGIAVVPSSTPAIAIVSFGVLGFGMGVGTALIFALQADTVDYGEWKSGIRAEGGSYAILSFTRKTGQGIGGFAAAITLGIGGYAAEATTQTDAALTSIRVAAGALPAVGMLAAAAIMLAYPLTERTFRRMVAEVAARRAEATLERAGAAEAARPTGPAV